MRKLTKIFAVVAGAMFAFSCTTDTTEDLGVQVGANGGQTEITLSLEESRTQLGEKAGDLYPLYWSEGDKISVNGVESGEAAISSSNASVATFTVNGDVATPYCIAYPAAPAGQVLFADQQTHAGDTTFGKGVSTMYAYGTSTGVQLNHLTGVLKIGITGDATLSLAQISTADRAPIAGAFEIDFATGEVTATESSKYVINYNIPVTADAEGLVLSSTPQYIHVAVPAGVYDELYVTLYDNEGGVMYATVKADDTKPLAVGKVREFNTPVLYAANASVFVVKDKASLLDFAAQAATLEKDVLFVADVDMEGEAWTPIEGYAGTVLGNGYAINGLTAPLFGTTSASIKGLHLTNVALNSNDAPHYGALVCEAVTTDTKSVVIEHCSAQGTFVVENKNYKPVAPTITNTQYSNDATKASEMAYGGLVGLSRGTTISNCVNNVAITVKQVVAEGDTQVLLPYIGGVVGITYRAVLADNSSVYTNLNDCVNNAAILYEDKNCSTELWQIFPAVGGVAGGVYHGGAKKETANVGQTYTNCVNNGAVKINTNGGGLAQDTQGYPQTQIGGIVGRGGYMTLFNCDNYGAVTLNGKFKQTYSGGVTGSSWYSNLENCDNYGAVTITEESTFYGIMLAGISSINYSTGEYTYYSKNCTNNAPINCLASTDPNATTGTYHYRIGGVEGFGRSLATNLVNNKEGVVTCKGNVVLLKANFKACEIGGVVAYRTTCAHDASCNYGDVIVDINYSVHPDVADTKTVIDDRALFIGGVAGYSSQTCKNSINKGNITVKGTYDCENIWIGGIGGYSSLGSVAENYGKITVDDSTIITNARLIVGGVGGGNDATSDRTGLLNKGKVYVGGKIGQAWIGGLCGQNRLPLTGAKNYGEVKVTAVCSKDLHVGGLICLHTRHFYHKDSNSIKTGDTANGALTSCENYGNIFIANTEANKSTVTVGGLVRQGQQDLIDCINHGSINVSGSSLGTLYIGGLVAVNSAKPRKNCYNKGKITVNCESVGGADNTDSDLFIGGICFSGGSNTTYTNCHNEGDIEIGAVKVANCVRIGGFIANVETADKTNTLENCSNSGNITTSHIGCVQTSGVCRIGGIFAQAQKGTLKLVGTLKNSGNINVACDHRMDIGISLGGIIGGADGDGVAFHDDTNCVVVNEGAINFTGKTVGKFYIGGIVPFISKTNIPSTVKLINTGDISVTGTCGEGYEKECDISGVIGAIKAPIDGAQCFCNIYAPNYSATRIGMLTSKTRSTTVLYTNAKVGGTIIRKIEKIGEDSEGNPQMGEITETLAADNYFNYIYGTTPDWSTITPEHDGCSYISSKAEIDYSEPVEPEVTE